MPADKALALGALVKVDHDNDLAFTTLEAVVECKPPGEEYNMVDVTTLADTMEQTLAGLLKQTEFPVLHFWDPTDTNHIIPKTLFDSKAKVNWQIVFANFPATITLQFQGQVVMLDPEPLKKDAVVARRFKVLRTGNITIT